jgi:bifunctional non-homologous end joining protein LigD
MLTRSPLARDRRRPPGFIRPCQPVLAPKVPADDGWLHELKHDGFRIIAHKDGDDVRLWSRNGPDWSVEFAAITGDVSVLPFHRIVIDGEAVAHCPEGLPDFHRLLGPGCATACLYAFDLLHVGQDDVRRLELVERRALLRKYTARAGPAILYSEHMDAANGEVMFRHACRLGLEGVVSKRATSRYKSGRCDAWRKVKNPEYVRRSIGLPA